MENIKMRRSKFRKLCFLLVLGLTILAGYYAYEQKIKHLYNKYSRLLQLDEERERIALMKIKEQQSQKHHQNPDRQNQQDGRHQEVVDGVKFIIDERHESKQDDDQQQEEVQNIPKIPQQQQDKPQEDAPGILEDLDDQQIPDDTRVLKPHDHDHDHGDHEHKVERLGVVGDRKIEKEVLNGVEFIVDHNGEDVPVKNDGGHLQSLIKDVEEKDGPLKDEKESENEEESLSEIHNLMKEYRERINAEGPKDADKAVNNGGQLAKPVVEDQQVGKQPEPMDDQSNENKAVYKDEDVQENNGQSVQGNSDDEFLKRKYALMQKLGIQESLTDRVIVRMVMSGKLSEADSRALMEFHSGYRRALPAQKPVKYEFAPPPPRETPSPTTPDLVEQNKKEALKDLEMKGGLPMKHVSLYDLNQEADLMYKCVKLILLTNETTICINDPKIDKPISAALAEKGTWESQNLKEFQRALTACPTCGVIDLGSNLGVYSLTAAKYGRFVVAVEPLLENIGPFHKSVQLNGFTDKIVLLRNAVADQHGYMQVKYPVPPNNLGAVYVEPVDYKKAMKGNIDSNIIKVVTLDDLKYFSAFKSAILKIDIQGLEHSVFKSTKKFFEHFDVPYIFMHWAYEEYKQTTLETADILIRKGYKPKITIGGSVIGVKALTRDQSLLIWVKQYNQQ